MPLVSPDIPQLQAIQYLVFCHAPFHVCLVGEHKESGSREPLFFSVSRVVFSKNIALDKVAYLFLQKTV